MVCLLCESDQTYSRLARLAGSETECVRIKTWEAAYAFAPEASTFVFARTWIAREHARRLRALRHLVPDLPIIVLTAREADNCRALIGTGVDRVVWVEDASRAFRECLRASDATAYLKRLAGRVHDAHALDVRLRRALTVLLTVPPPVPSVAELATAAGCSTTTLWRLVSRSSDAGGSVPSLKVASRWTMVVHAVALKRSGRAWSVVAERLGVHVDTLARTAASLTGTTLSSLSSRGLRPLIEEYGSRVIEPLLQPPPAPRHENHDPAGVKRIAGESKRSAVVVTGSPMK